MTLLHLDETNFQQEVIKSNEPVLVDFYADWCGPCKVLGPTIEQLAQEWTGRVKVAKVNVDNAQRLAAEYNIRGIPTMIFFREGKDLERVSGALPKEQIEGLLEKLTS
jgi:thioredoxin 1